MLMRRPPQTPPTAGNPQTSNAMSATMKDLPRPDPNWNSAMEWLLWIQESPDDEELRAACRAWQQASPAHARAWQRAERVWRLSGQLPRTSHRRWPGMRRRRFAVIGSALAACLALLMVLLPWHGHGELDNGKGAPRQLVLEDGSRVWLKGGSAIRPRFDDDHRHLDLLQGEVFFEVTPDASRPFTVQAGDSRVEVTGTAFSVALQGPTLSVAVEHGSVRVEDPRRNTRLKGGDRMRLDTRDGLRMRDRVMPARVAAWRRGELIAEDQPIGELLEQLRPHYAGWILLQDPALANERVTGRYDLQHPQAALQALVQPHGGRVESWSPYLLVIRR
ncbi:hypothetical protein CXK94_00545 [Stutzerimonas stutzeri]|uniref:FecR family protein n=2 Tax=Stutzerimonas stutzeri TaxID=316 RepID=A0A2N8T8M6_STUST|nr:hypothetical protein CXK94_00545 [Stutzerimonas stutzeri]